MIGINMAEKDDTAQVVVNNNDPTYKSEHTDTLVYNPEGATKLSIDCSTR
ncbi:putative organic solvent tolerance protein [Escherichia coli]|uniref:Putative organic solvent tolerance protein n=1 Tax=Escherichia coli TaxID=562 RepID=A0A376KKB7_ECOLX|nr:putative organic solvent tolerance protein [Escherichia coli]